MAQLLNIAEANGIFDEVPVDASTQLTVELSALSITKVADKAVWVKDALTYTITVTNVDTATPGLPVTDVSVEDTIDPEIATLIDGSVTIDGTPAVAGTDYTFNTTTGLLSFPALSDLAPRATHVISFQVSLV